MAERHLLGRTGIRLALATVAVALAAIGLLSALTLVAAGNDVSRLGRIQEQRTLTETATAVADAYLATPSWDAANLRVAAHLAADSRATLSVLDAAGRAVPVPSGSTGAPATLDGPVLSAPVEVDGQRVGTVILHFYEAALPSRDVQLRDALARTVAAGAGLAALLALAVAVGLSRWITRPVASLTSAVRALEAGDRAARAGPVRGPGEVVELSAAFDRMAATITREDELRRAVVADVAHELRTPLAILQAGTESLVDRVTAPTRQALSSLHDEVLRLGRSVEDLDTLASAEAAGLRIDRRAGDLGKVADTTLASLRPAFAAAGVLLVEQLSPTPALLDAHRAGQVLTNLLTNALKFTPAGGSVTVTVEPAPGAAVLVVADTGAGIPPDELPHVFDRFWRGRQAGRVAGSGIGLAVVRALVDAHGGQVSVTSSADRGTRFEVRFPRSGAPVDRSEGSTARSGA